MRTFPLFTALLPALLVVGPSLALAQSPSPSDSAFGDTDKLRIAVMDLKATSGFPEELSGSLTDVMTEALDRQGVFKPISTRDIARMMDFEAQKETLGCTDDTSCLADLVGAMGAQYLVTGSITLLGEQYLLQLQLFDIDHARVMRRESRDYEGPPSGLLKLAEGAVQALVRDLLAASAGHLVVEASEPDATVRVDDRIVGVTPLPLLELGGGVHKVEVLKEGFITVALDVEVKKGETTRVEAKLVPSPAYREAYTQRAWLVRGASFAGMGVGALGLLGAGALYGGGLLVADGLRTRIDTYNAAAVREQAELDDIRRELQTLNAMDTGVIVAASVGVIALGAGVATFFLGPDPGRYEE